MSTFRFYKRRIYLSDSVDFLSKNTRLQLRYLCLSAESIDFKFLNGSEIVKCGSLYDDNINKV